MSEVIIVEKTLDIGLSLSLRGVYRSLGAISEGLVEERGGRRAELVGHR